MLGATPSDHAEAVAPLPDRWNACLAGQGELDLSGVRVLSETQVMWPVGGRLTQLALGAAAYMLQAKTRKLDVSEFPDVFSGLSDFPVFVLPEKVVDVASLVEVLSTPHILSIREGSVESLSQDGYVVVSGVKISTRAVICAAGLGNEELLTLMNVGDNATQRRPLRQFMVKTMPFPLYGHGITASYRPRVTVTSYPLSSGGYLWYLGGGLADDTISLKDDEAISFAKKEMMSIFDHLNWDAQHWSTWYGVRAEARSQNGRLPSGPVVQEYGNAMFVWPTKLTLAPLLGDYVLARLAAKGIEPRNFRQRAASVNLPLPRLAVCPWDRAAWS